MFKSASTSLILLGHLLSGLFSLLHGISRITLGAQLHSQ
jgi:hypothetical protein